MLGEGPQLYTGKRKSKPAGADLREWECKASELAVPHSAVKIMHKTGRGHGVEKFRDKT